MRFKSLYQELSAVASCELGDCLDSWDALSGDQAARVARYLRSELAPYGMLSVEKGAENGEAMDAIRRDARAFLKGVA